MPQPPALIVCERRQTWSVAWRRAFRAEPLRLIETRGLESCEAALREHPGSIAAVEVTLDNLERVALAIERWNLVLPHSAVIVLGDAACRPAEWVLRSAGAMHTEFSPRHLRRLIPLVRRQWQTAPPLPEKTWLEQLPWGTGV